MNFDFYELPCFHVEKIIDEKHLMGQLDDSSPLQEGWIAYLYFQDNYFIEGRFTQLNNETRKAIFEIKKPEKPKIDIHKAYPSIDGYWGERAELATDLKRRWQHKQFQPTETWDHEHCEICWEKIAEYAQPYGYCDQSDTWICENCFKQFVSLHSCDFLLEVRQDLYKK